MSRAQFGGRALRAKGHRHRRADRILRDALFARLAIPDPVSPTVVPYPLFSDGLWSLPCLKSRQSRSSETTHPVESGGASVPSHATNARTTIPAPASSQRLLRRRVGAPVVSSWASASLKAGVRRKRLSAAKSSMPLNKTSLISINWP